MTPTHTPGPAPTAILTWQERRNKERESLRHHGFNDKRLPVVSYMEAEIADLRAALAARAPIYIPIATDSKAEAGGRHPNDKTPKDAGCQDALNARGDDTGQGLCAYWKWGFRSGWQAALAARVAPPEQGQGRREAHEENLALVIARLEQIVATEGEFADKFANNLVDLAKDALPCARALQHSGSIRPSAEPAGQQNAAAAQQVIRAAYTQPPRADLSKNNFVGRGLRIAEAIAAEAITGVAGNAGSAKGGNTCAEMRALCSACGGTGDVHSLDGEWRGSCDCEASVWSRTTPPTK